jgi:Rps23 Pro-64 3,4-dihydroxylase Tpa1-like proline 4-hydroxylase
MNKEILDGDIVIYKNVMNEQMDILSELDYIFKTHSQNWQVSSINDRDYSDELRSCMVYSLYPTDDKNVSLKNDKVRINDIMNFRLSKAYFDYIKSYNIKVKEREFWEILRYEESQKLIWHQDGGELHPCDISFVYYFNDNYEGGEIQFKDWMNGELYKPPANSLIIFPSDARYIHRVVPVTKGVKYCAISFAK